MFQDEARFGRINDPKRCWSPKRTRPTVGKQIIREYTYAYGAVSPRDGAADFLILPVMTAVAMKVFLDELARRHDGQYILMIYDGAPCHSPGALNIPCPSSKQMGLLSVFHKGGSGSSLFDVKPLGVDGSSGGFGWSVF